jgi:hypothetical protein
MGAIGYFGQAFYHLTALLRATRLDSMASCD